MLTRAHAPIALGVAVLVGMAVVEAAMQLQALEIRYEEFPF
jgi:hypothetical protein